MNLKCSCVGEALTLTVDCFQYYICIHHRTLQVTDKQNLDTTRIQAFSALEQLPYMSKRFLMKRYLGLTEDELQENTEQWEEETGQPIETDPTGSDLRTVGVSPGDIEGDVAMGDAVAGEEGADPALG